MKQETTEMEAMEAPGPGEAGVAHQPRPEVEVHAPEHGDEDAEEQDEVGGAAHGGIVTHGSGIGSLRDDTRHSSLTG